MNHYENKTLLLIGAGIMQVPAIKIANEIGLTTVVTDYNEKAPGMSLADYPLVVSTRDCEGTVRVIKDFHQRQPIDGVLTVGTDASMTVAAVANALNLPGIKFENAEAASNKIKMRQRFKENAVPSPQFFKCWSLGDLERAVKEIGYPLVIKPSDNMGARGVMKIENPEMLEKAFLNAKNACPSGELIAEEYMKGAELSIDALVYENEIHITGVADRIIEREPYFIEMGHVMPSALDQNTLDDAIDVFKQGIRALGINMGAAKGDIKITAEGAKIGEIAARLSGGFMSAYTFPYASGVNLIQNAIDIALGYPPHNLIPTKDWVSIEHTIIPKPGIIREIQGLEEARAIPGTLNIFLNSEIGDEVVEPKSNVDKPLNFIIARATREEAWQTVNKLQETIKIITDGEKTLTWNEIRHHAREKFNRSCYACVACNGKECRGKIPGVGGIGNGEAFIRNVRDFSRIVIETTTIHEVKEAATAIEFCGTKLRIPVIAAPITGCDINLGGMMSELDYDEALVKGCKEAGIIAFVGDGAQPDLYKVGLKALAENQGWGGAIFKPRDQQSDILTRIKDSNSIPLHFVGVDVDAAVGFVTMDMMQQKIAPKSVPQLKELADAAQCPFVIKGIMSEDDALSAVQSGAEVIVVSNHGGRITQSHPSSVSVLSEIVEAVKHKVKIVLDGGIRSGEDIFKSLALGADAVMIGRPFSIAVMGGGVQGVKVLVEKYQQELQKIMLLTGSKTIADIQPESVFFDPYS
ncbi:MAG: alpha-hydroxy-acid oxidizing protein [Spirochaetes bacterium]|nr:alpha-hydroxy-acid oxidizing protein [Spirochaetota bacterium]